MSDKKIKSGKLKRKQNAERKERKRERQRQAAAEAKKSKEVQNEGVKTLLEKARRGSRSPGRTIRLLFEGSITKEEIPTFGPPKVAEQVYRNLEAKDRKTAGDFLACILEKSKLLNDVNTATIGLITQLVWNKDLWVRTPDSWVPGTKNIRRQRASLLRHMLAKYPVPLFLDASWHNTDRVTKAPAIGREWFLHIGAGKNIRTAKRLPFTLTKRMAHHFLGAPSQFHHGQALTWGEILALGGSPRIVLGLADHFTTNALMRAGHDHFWSSVWRFFIDNPFIATDRYGPILDFLYNQRYAGHVQRGDGTFGPQQPNLSMHRRNPGTLLQQVENWHTALHKIKVADGKKWPPSGMCQPKGAKHSPKPVRGCMVYVSGTKNKRVEYAFTELLSNTELAAEGRALSHCVYTYTRSCVAGIKSIWSLRKTDQHGVDVPILTIEVDNRSKMILQARGKHNKFPSQAVYKLMRRWATKSGLSISTWIKSRNA